MPMRRKMEKNDRNSRDDRNAGGRRRPGRRKVCRFCADKESRIDYKDARGLGNYLTERGKIIPRRISGVCAPHQRRLTDAIKKARNIALVPFAAAI